jgi:hypothetical protein
MNDASDSERRKHWAVVAVTDARGVTTPADTSAEMCDSYEQALGHARTRAKKNPGRVSGRSRGSTGRTGSG